METRRLRTIKDKIYYLNKAFCEKIAYYLLKDSMLAIANTDIIRYAYDMLIKQNKVYLLKRRTVDGAISVRRYLKACG